MNTNQDKLERKGGGLINKLSEKLKKLRKEKEITQAELAEVLDVSTSMVGMYETNSRNPSYEILIKIADYFDVSVDYLLGRETFSYTSNQITLNLENVDSYEVHRDRLIIKGDFSKKFISILK
ncbi:DNA-binding transcriptional regulator, XRE-family HTH domain [Orenia metallireducens]|uniref:DNA-binding transcriptional regulator, XRE-family HTH domain n=1 Tax=Orenia metallireducens TaxID=1413210 RepID=A0A285G6P3_9FIRM|nr:helix-turn-helix transcriptional regulator [Orenia metallireducens]SNY19209.1 DNA-binding transcriptional regulator, XRE-family HTH domain [Orenia metallireducens]